jgi:hypothetical protein
MESTGVKNKIHTSNDTANLLIAAGKGQWLSNRSDDVMVKGKGIMNTFWVSLHQGKKTASVGSSETSASGNLEPLDIPDQRGVQQNKGAESGLLDGKYRLIKWNTDTLTDILKQIVVYRTSSGSCSDSDETLASLESQLMCGVRARDEMVEVVCLPGYNAQRTWNHENPDEANEIELSDVVLKELFSFVSTVASMYQGKCCICLRCCSCTLQT